MMLATGVISGVLAGLLGIGGGLVIVPALTFILGPSSPYVIHTAIGTSLAVIILTALSSTRAHHKKGSIDWYYWILLTPGLFNGTLLGALIADQLEGAVLRQFFALFELLVAIQLAVGLKAKPAQKEASVYKIFLMSFPIGIICAFAGIGGGIMVVPLLCWLRLSIKQAVSTSAACGLPIAVAGSIGFLLMGLDADHPLSSSSTGFIYWPALLYIGVPSILFAPLGAKLAHALPAVALRLVFAAFLLILAALMFFVQ